MSKMLKLAVLIVMSSTIFIMGCSKKKSTKPEPPDTIISDKVVILEEKAGVSLDTVEDSTYIFKFTGERPKISRDDILIGTEGGGYLRRVTSVTTKDSSITIETGYAVLTDAIIKGSLDTTIQLSIEELHKQSGEGLGLVYAAKGVSVADRIIDLSGIELFSGKVSGADVKVSIVDGSVSFDPAMDVGLTIENSQIREFHTIARGKLSFDCDLRVTASDAFTYSREINIATFQYYVYQYVGFPPLGIPIIEVITLNFDAGFECETAVEGTTEFGFESSIDVSFGARYNEGVWSSVWEKEPNFKAHKVVWTAKGKAEMRGYIRPNISVKLYSVAGPYLEVEPYLRFVGEVPNFPLWNWNLYAGIVGRLGFEVKILDYELASYNTELSQYEVKIAQDSYSSVRVAFSDFDAGSDGWNCVGDGTCSNPNNGGNPAGFFKNSDPATGENTVAVAPSKFLGDWSALNGTGYLQFDQIILSSSGDHTEGPNLIVEGPGGRATAKYEPTAGPPVGSWQAYTFLISEGSWTITSGSWTGLLANITSLKIDMEFIAGVEETGLDNVILAKTQ